MRWAAPWPAPYLMPGIRLPQGLELLGGRRIKRIAGLRVPQRTVTKCRAKTYYTLAHSYSVLSNALKAKNASQAEELAVRGIGFLKQSEAKGAFKDEHQIASLKKNTGFDSLRQRKDFQDWLEHLEATSAGSK